VSGKSRPAVLLGHDRAEISLRRELGHEIEIEVSVAVVLAGPRDDLLVGERAGGFLDHPLLVSEFEVHGCTVHQWTEHATAPPRRRRGPGTGETRAAEGGDPGAGEGC